VPQLTQGNGAGVMGGPMDGTSAAIGSSNLDGHIE
jgi:hypothetical protein